MSEIYEKLQSCLAQLREKTDFVPRAAVVLGSGLGGFADDIDVVARVPYGELGGFPVSTVEGHSGRFVFGYCRGVPVVVMQGRVHYYEGYPMQQVVMPVRLMKLMGAEKLLLTCAAGGINRDFYTGALMLFRDHISLFAPNPLIGANVDELGPRFPDMTQIYDPELSQSVRAAAERLGLELKEGVYAQLTGPSFESATEIKMLGALGADAVGMSTVCEAIAARHMGMRVCAVSCISNMAAGLQGKPLSHEDVQEAAAKVGADFRKLIAETISEF